MKSERYRSRENGRARWAAALFAVALTMVVAVVARALTAGNVDGVWGSPTPAGTSNFRWCYAPDVLGGPAGAPTACNTSSAAIQNPPDSTTSDENQIRYGTPTSGSLDVNRSGYGFNGNNSVGSIAAATPFFLGRFTHYNRPITATTSLASVPLTVTLTGLLCDDNSVPTEGGTQSFAYTFTHEETPNSPPCAYGDSTGNGCDDRVTVNTVPDRVHLPGGGAHCSSRASSPTPTAICPSRARRRRRSSRARTRTTPPACGRACPLRQPYRRKPR
jgi:hypothetical protein